MHLLSQFSTGNTGNTGNSQCSCGFQAFPELLIMGEHGEQKPDLFPLFPEVSGLGERRKAFIHAVVPHVPSVPWEKHGGTSQIRGRR